MASQQSPAHVDHFATTPHLMAPHSALHSHSVPTSTSPPSPSAIAAAVTLATLADSQTALAYGEDAGVDEEEDEDQSGGISLADYQQFVGPSTAEPQYLDTDEAVTMLGPATMDQIQSWAHPMHSYTFDTFDTLDSFFTANAHLSAPPMYGSHMSTYDHPLEPPATLQEIHLSIQDRTSFAPITSFFHYLTPEKPTVPGLDLIQVPLSISQDDLQGDRYDHQGIDWTVRNTTRSLVRTKRKEFEKERLPLSMKKVRETIAPTKTTNNFFEFRRNNTAHRAFFPHFQLRNVLAATSRNDIFYAAGHRVFRTDAEGTSADVITDLSKRLASDGSITTITTSNDVLVAGAFEGEYAITNLSSECGSSCTFGRTTDFTVNTKSRIVNQLHVFESRTTYTPQAVFCSNDHRLRILDCTTNTFTHSFLYPAAVNCSATSPDGRLRVVVGDFHETLITNAETGQPFETLNSHVDDVFACAWADDGIHIATAAQDSTIVVWDARHWNNPLTVLTSELGVPRSLRFSPVGSGPQVLIAAEADDYINVINAQTFQSKQVFDFFGPIGGTAITPDGQSLLIANGERRFGGIVELGRTGWAEKTARNKPWDDADWDAIMTDWTYDDELRNHDRVSGGAVQRRRRNVDMTQLIV